MAFRTYRVRIYLRKDQKSQIFKYRDAQRYAYNWTVAHLNKPVKKKEFELSVMFTTHKSKHAWMKEIPRVYFNIGIKAACKAYELSKSHGRGKPLAYRSKKISRTKSLRCALAPVCKDKYFITLPRFGDVRCQVPQEILDGSWEPRSYEFVDVTKDAARVEDRDYILMLNCKVHVDTTKQQQPPRISKAIDRGTVEPTVIITHDIQANKTTSKESLNTAAPFNANRTKHQNTQRKASKMNKKSKRYKKMQSRWQKQSKKTKNQRAYAECIAAKEICNDADLIILENLKLEKMTRKGRGRNKRHLNRELRFVRHYMLLMRILNIAELLQIKIIMVNPQYTSQTCFVCGNIDKASRITRDLFKCIYCGNLEHADINAARNINRAGLLSVGILQESVPTEAGMPFERRELDVRSGCFVACNSKVDEGSVLKATRKHKCLTSPAQKCKRKNVEGMIMFCEKHEFGTNPNAIMYEF